MILLKGLEHHIGNLICCVRPDINNLIVALPGSNNAFAVLFLNTLNLLLCNLNFLTLLLRNDHIINPDGNARAGRFSEAQFLKLIKSLNRPSLTRAHIRMPDQVAQLAFPHGEVGETQFLRPNLAE